MAQGLRRGGHLVPCDRSAVRQNPGMSLQELQNEVTQLSPEDRARLRAHLESLEVFSDSKVMEEWTQTNRAAEAGAVVSRDEAIARLQPVGKQATEGFRGMPGARYFWLGRFVGNCSHKWIAFNGCLHDASGDEYEPLCPGRPIPNGIIAELTPLSACLFIVSLALCKFELLLSVKYLSRAFEEGNSVIEAA
jgi:hypothetical protein